MPLDFIEPHTRGMKVRLSVLHMQGLEDMGVDTEAFVLDAQGLEENMENEGALYSWLSESDVH